MYVIKQLYSQMVNTLDILIILIIFTLITMGTIWLLRESIANFLHKRPWFTGVAGYFSVIALIPFYVYKPAEIDFVFFAFQYYWLILSSCMLFGC